MLIQLRPPAFRQRYLPKANKRAKRQKRKLTRFPGNLRDIHVHM